MIEEFALDVRSDQRLKQDEVWSQAVVDGRAHVSHREFSLQFGKQFVQSIDIWQIVEDLVNLLFQETSRISKLTPELLRIIVDFTFMRQGSMVVASILRRELCPDINSPFHLSLTSLKPFLVFARKRPLLAFELSQGAYDTCHTSANNITFHDGKMARNGRQITMTHRNYLLDRVFNEDDDNSVVCPEILDPLLARSLQGKNTTLLCFGQTGTGKTFTFSGALSLLSDRLRGRRLRLSCCEVYGNRCFDLLAERKQVFLRSDAEGRVHLRGAREVEVVSLEEGEELTELLGDALSLRTSKVTERNPISSRSHAIFKIKVFCPSGKKSGVKSLAELLSERGKGPERAVEETHVGGAWGSISLVDLAGSERNYETQRMTAQEHRDSALINASLMALKDCFRASACRASCPSPRALPQPSLKEEEEEEAEVDEKAEIEPVPPTPLSSSSFVSRRGISATLRALSLSCASRPLEGSEDKSLGERGVGGGGVGGGAVFCGRCVPPYRSSLLTRVLRECFEFSDGEPHFTSLVVCLSPSPVDIEHSLNSLDHALLMAPLLSPLSSSVTVEVAPFGNGLPPLDLPVHMWNPQHLSSWLATTDGGRFRQVFLPPSMSGSDLLGLGASDLCSLYEEGLALGAMGRGRRARRQEEGEAWVETAEEGSRSQALGRALFVALRREEQVRSKLRAELIEEGGRVADSLDFQIE